MLQMCDFAERLVTVPSEIPAAADFSSLLSRLCGAASELADETFLQQFQQTIDGFGFNSPNDDTAFQTMSGGPFANSLSLTERKWESEEGWDELMVFDTLLAYSRFFVDAAVNRREEFSGSLALPFDGRQGDVYTEEAFRHFLRLERIRATRSERQFLLLLASLRHCPKRGARFSSGIAANLLNGLGLCVREVDFVGWYRHERVAGAVLAQGDEGPDSEAPNRIVERVSRVLQERLPRDVASRLRVRVLRFGAREQQ